METAAPLPKIIPSFSHESLYGDCAGVAVDNTKTQTRSEQNIFT